MNWILWAYPPDEPAAALPLDPARGTHTIGREEGVDVRLAHPSVSRLHARLVAEHGGWRVEDAGSKNGVRFSGRRVESEGLRAGEWFVIGDIYCRLQAEDATAGRERAAQITRRRAQSRAEASRAVAAPDANTMFATLIAGFVATADCRRGFVLVGERSERLHVRASYRIDARMLGGDGFDGSTGVIERALRERRAVLAGDALAQPWLRDRPSVVAQGIRAAVCLPLVHDGRVLGALYADTDETGRQFTTLDAELLAEWAHQAVLLRVAQALEDRLAAVAGCVIADDGDMPAATVAAPAWNGTRP